MLTKIKTFVLLLAFWQQGCTFSPEPTATRGHAETVETQQKKEESAPTAALQVGAERMEHYLPLLEGKRLGLVVNQTSSLDNVHLVDTLLSAGMDIKAVFAPEHGFRGEADAGEKIVDARDPQTGLPIISLYGKHKEPSAKDLANIDLIIFDIQDVGARFYTYISTLHYVMQAASKHNKRVLVLDRPNPNGHYVDGPIRTSDYKSFVGMHPIPVVHGMTVGEYAQMINGEGWLDGGQEAQLVVVPCSNYTHETVYELPIRPSPNLPNARSIYLYPSLCFFEGTVFSVGRGTNTQFQVYGHPEFTQGDHYFTPESGPGAKYPKLEGKRCRGIDFTTVAPATIRTEGRLNLSHLLNAYHNYPDHADFFLSNNFIDKLAGTDQLRKQIIEGWDEAQIRASWQEELASFRQTREKYLLYK
ncbi:MAG: DUF1343 domain-containing protein [Bacteroidota bacterium]